MVFQQTFSVVQQYMPALTDAYEVGPPSERHMMLSSEPMPGVESCWQLEVESDEDKVRNTEYPLRGTLTMFSLTPLMPMLTEDDKVSSTGSEY